MAFGNGGTAAAAMAYAQTNSVIGNAPQPLDESPSKIRDGLGYIENQVGELHDALSLLEKRLDTVLTPAAPQAGQEQAKQPTAVTSHVFGRLNVTSEGLGMAILRIRDVVRRIEV